MRLIAISCNFHNNNILFYNMLYIESRYMEIIKIATEATRSHICGKVFISMASTLKNTQKKAIAKELYLHGDYTFEEIAAKVDATRQTIARWAKDDGWADLKASMTVGKDKTLKNLYAHVQRINEDILQREDGARVPTPKEADILAKLAAAIDKIESESGIHELVGAGMAFLTWLRKINPEKAIEFTELWDAFIKEKL